MALKIILPIFALAALALAQSTPKAVLLEVGTSTAHVVATLENTKWTPTTDNASPATKSLLENKGRFALLTDVGVIGTASIIGAVKPSQNCGAELSFKTSSKLSRQIYGLVAPWNIQPRKIERIPLANATYQKVISQELAARGIKAPVQMTQILKVDLDNDKSDEIILVAQRPALSPNFEMIGMGYAMKAHNYALALVRKVTPSGVKTFVLREAFTKSDFDGQKYADQGSSPPFRFTTWVNGISDFDGDGKMEVLVNTILWEGYGFDVYRWAGNKFSSFLEWGCL